jgi:23S rRNA (guanosine2251-2'-O)-methyltransferase
LGEIRLCRCSEESIQIEIIESDFYTKVAVIGNLFCCKSNYLCKVKHFRQQHKQQNRPKKSDMVIGTIHVAEAMQEGIALDKIFINHKSSERVFEQVLQLALVHNVPVQKVPVEKINGLNVGEHDGCIAIRSKIIYQDLQQVIDVVVGEGKTPLFLVLDGITDVRNIGGIARSAYAMGVQAIIIPEKGVGALNEDAILTSAGALEKLAVCRVKSLMKAIDDLHLNGIRVFASEMEAEKTIADLDFTTPCAIVMGGEENGIYPALMKICDEKFYIAMQNNFESLNVSVATGIILYEVNRQRL